MEPVVDERPRSGPFVVRLDDGAQRLAPVLGGERDDRGGAAAGRRHAGREEIVGGHQSARRLLIDMTVRVDAARQDQAPRSIDLASAGPEAAAAGRDDPADDADIGATRCRSRWRPFLRAPPGRTSQRPPRRRSSRADQCVDLGRVGRPQARPGRPRGGAADGAAAPQDLLAHGQAVSGLLLVDDQRQVGVEQVFGAVTVAGHEPLVHLDQHVGEREARHRAVGAARPGTAGSRGRRCPTSTLTRAQPVALAVGADARQLVEAGAVFELEHHHRRRTPRTMRRKSDDDRKTSVVGG